MLQANDLSDITTQGIMKFTDECFSDMQGLLIHSLNGKNRCVVAALVIFMQRYRWGLIKTLEFLNAKKPGLEMTASLLKKLLQFEQRLEFDKLGVLTKDWDTQFPKGPFHMEEVILVNSYKNSFKSDHNLLKFIPRKPSVRKRFGVRWKETNEVFEIENNQQLLQLQQPDPMSTYIDIDEEIRNQKQQQQSYQSMVDRIVNDVRYEPNQNELAQPSHKKEDHYNERIQLFIEDNSSPSIDQIRLR